jgi:hypothetical protein
MLHGLGQRQAPENLVSLIFDESQGNPFFVEELYRHLLEDGKVFDAAGRFRTDITIDEIDVPENVRLIIGRRLERLDENEKRVLAAAAVIGRSFSFELLAGMSQIDVAELFTAIEKAQQMGIIVPSAEGPERPFIFGHDLCVRRYLPASPPRANSDCTPVSRTKSSGSILAPSTSTPETSQTICSKQGRSPTTGNWSII